MNYVVHVSSTMWRLKNQPCHFASCSDNALRLLVLVAGRLSWGLQVTSSFSIWGCAWKSCFERGIFWRAKSRLKGIEDFNLEHWPHCLTKPISCYKWSSKKVHPKVRTMNFGTDRERSLSGELSGTLKPGLLIPLSRDCGLQTFFLWNSCTLDDKALEF